MNHPHVYFVPKEVATRLKAPINLIAIYGPYDCPLEFKPKHNLLRLQFANHYEGMSELMAQKMISEEQIQKIIDFVKACKGEDIVVHCGEGRIRSPALAQFIEYMTMEGFVLEDSDEERPGYIMSGQYMGANHGDGDGFDRETFHKCRGYFDKLVEAGNPWKAASVDNLQA